MKFGRELVEEIKLRLKVSDVVSKKVKLKPRGKEFVGLSPFSNEKTPSFTVSDEKEFFHCFSSGEHGSIFDFVMKTENLSFKDAVKKLAQEVGISVEDSFDNKSNKVIAIDYGAKNNILRNLASLGCKITVVPSKTSAKNIFQKMPDGIFLSNGPGDPAATGKFSVPLIKEILKKNIPTFGICLGHQMLALALGAKTKKMHLGHRGANHPVLETNTGKVIITVQNHGFEVIENSLPKNARVSYKSLFDGSVEGIELKDKPVFSVQYHPEASPGPHDHLLLFKKFYKLIEKNA